MALDVFENKKWRDRTLAETCPAIIENACHVIAIVINEYMKVPPTAVDV